MKFVYALVGALLVLAHLGLALGGYDPFATSSNERLGPGDRDPNGPSFIAAGFHGGK